MLALALANVTLIGQAVAEPPKFSPTYREAMLCVAAITATRALAERGPTYSASYAFGQAAQWHVSFPVEPGDANRATEIAVAWTLAGAGQHDVPIAAYEADMSVSVHAALRESNSGSGSAALSERAERCARVFAASHSGPTRAAVNAGIRALYAPTV